MNRQKSETPRDLTTMEYIILGLLSTGPQTGYMISQTLENAASHWSASAGAIYPALKRLEKRGIIEGVVETVRATRPRKVYRITPAGESMLDKWLRAPLTTDEMLNEREIPLIKFLFAEQRLSRDDVLAWLNAYEQGVDSYTAAHRQWHEMQLGVSSIHQQLFLQATQMEMDMQRDWIHAARTRLAALDETRDNTHKRQDVEHV